MNAEKAQTIINQIVEDYRKNDYKNGLKQHRASKKYIARAEELGILDMIPTAPGSRGEYIGNTEIQLILEAAEDGGSQAGGFNEYGEGDVVSVGASDLYNALNEVEAVEEPVSESQINIGTQVIVEETTVYGDLSHGAVVTPMYTRDYHRHETTITDIWSDELYDHETDKITLQTVFVTGSGLQVTIDKIKKVVS